MRKSKSVSVGKKVKKTESLYIVLGISSDAIIVENGFVPEKVKHGINMIPQFLS